MFNFWSSGWDDPSMRTFGSETGLLTSFWSDGIAFKTTLSFKIPPSWMWLLTTFLLAKLYVKRRIQQFSTSGTRFYENSSIMNKNAYLRNPLIVRDKSGESIVSSWSGILVLLNGKSNRWCNLKVYLNFVEATCGWLSAIRNPVDKKIRKNSIWIQWHRMENTDIKYMLF